MRRFEHLSPASLEEAAAALSAKPARAMAGGTDVLGELKDEIHAEYPQLVVDLKTIAGLDYVRSDQEGSANRGTYEARYRRRRSGRYGRLSRFGISRGKRRVAANTADGDRRRQHMSKHPMLVLLGAGRQVPLHEEGWKRLLCSGGRQQIPLRLRWCPVPADSLRVRVPGRYRDPVLCCCSAERGSCGCRPQDHVTQSHAGHHRPRMSSLLRNGMQPISGRRVGVDQGRRACRWRLSAEPLGRSRPGARPRYGERSCRRRRRPGGSFGRLLLANVWATKSPFSTVSTVPAAC